MRADEDDLPGRADVRASRAGTRHLARLRVVSSPDLEMVSAPAATARDLLHARLVVALPPLEAVGVILDLPGRAVPIGVRELLITRRCTSNGRSRRESRRPRARHTTCPAQRREVESGLDLLHALVERVIEPRHVALQPPARRHPVRVAAPAVEAHGGRACSAGRGPGPSASPCARKRDLIGDAPGRCLDRVIEELVALDGDERLGVSYFTQPSPPHGSRRALARAAAGHDARVEHRGLPYGCAFVSTGVPLFDTEFDCPSSGYGSRRSRYMGRAADRSARRRPVPPSSGAGTAAVLGHLSDRAAVRRHDGPVRGAPCCRWRPPSRGARWGRGGGAVVVLCCTPRERAEAGGETNQGRMMDTHGRSRDLRAPARRSGRTTRRQQRSGGDESEDGAEGRRRMPPPSKRSRAELASREPEPAALVPSCFRCGSRTRTSFSGRTLDDRERGTPSIRRESRWRDRRPGRASTRPPDAR